MYLFDRTSTCREWIGTDIPHGFGSTFPYQLSDLFMSKRPDVKPVKNGRLAIVLEDDTHQRERYGALVNEYTPLTVSALCTRPGELDRWIEDPQVGMFLLDIQNFDETRAGIVAAEDILRRRFAQLSSLGSDQTERLSIVVWSSSREAEEDAEQTLKKVILELDPARKVITGIGHGNRSCPISMEVRAKHTDLSWVFDRL